jgi:hypothetical protein
MNLLWLSNVLAAIFSSVLKHFIIVYLGVCTVVTLSATMEWLKTVSGKYIGLVGVG